MKRFLLMGLLAAAVGLLFDSAAGAWPLALERFGGCQRMGRIKGYWMQPTTGPLYDYSPYFAAQYPHLPGAGEYQWQPPNGGPNSAFGSSVAILPAAPPPGAVGRSNERYRSNPTQGIPTSNPR